MNKIDFADIFKNAWSVAWKNKFLWWLGFFMFVGSGMSNFSYRGNDGNSRLSQMDAAILAFAQQHLVGIIMLGLVSVLILLALWVAGVMSRATMIKATNNLETYRNMKLSSLLRAGASYFWKIVLLEISFGLFMLFFIMLLALPTVFLFYFGAWAAGIFVTLWALAILIPILFMVYVMRQYALLFVVLADTAIFKSVGLAYGLLKKKMSESLLMTFWMIMAGIIFGLVVLASLLLVAIVFAIIGFILYMLFSKIGALVAVGLGLLVWLGLLLIAGSLYEIFKQSAWVFFFKEISMQKTEEKLEETEKVSQPVASPEAV